MWLESVPTHWLQVAIVTAWVCILLLVVAQLNRYLSLNPEVLRKVVHIGTGNLILVAWWLSIPTSIGVGASVLASLVTLLSYRFPILPGLNSVGRKSLGTFFYAASIGILITWFWPRQQPQYAALGILVMTWGDGLAAVIGQRFGQHRYKVLGMQKSWEGTLTMCLVSFVVSSSVLFAIHGNIWQTWVVALAVALVATGLETFCLFGIDNLTVPLGSAALSYIFIQVLCH